MTLISRMLPFLAVLCLFFNSRTGSANPALPRPDHVVVVIEENHGFSNVIGNVEAPYINALARRGALFTQSFALAHPSQPNYLMLFAGSNLGVTDDNVPGNLPLSAPNLGAELLVRGQTFCGYAEDLPAVGFQGPQAGNYVRRHNPWVNWQGSLTNGIPSACNRPFASWPTDLNQLPTVAFVIPNLQNDMHDGSIAAADAWLKDKLDAYVQWAAGHNSLLIFTFDEDDNRNNQQIPAFFVGPMVCTGAYRQRITHYEVLRTIEDFYGLPPSGAAAQAQAINFCWQPSPEDIGPVIKANGFINTITIGHAGNLSITVQLDPGQYVGVPDDWWVVAFAGSSLYYLNSSGQWTFFDGNRSHCHPVYQGGLFNLPATEVLNITGLPVGLYTFYFAVDSPMDGILNVDGPIWVDSVNVTVQ